MEEDSKTYRERAVHARLGAREATSPQFRAVFERLAESYEAKARDAEWQEQPPVSIPEWTESSIPRRHAVKREA